MSSSAPLQIHDGAVALGGRPVLRGIDLTVRSGEVVAVLGSNGSGKSTLVRAALGLVPLTRGEVRLFDTPLPRFHAWQRIGYVPQRAAVSSGVPATVREVVSAGRLARRRLLRPLSGQDQHLIDAALDSVGLRDRQRDSVATLSGGQQQRVLIARALAGEPDLFVLDEPNSGVDLSSQVAFAEALRQMAADGATIVLVAHELGPLEPLIDRAVVVQSGRIVHEGAPRPTAGVHAFHDHPHAEPTPDHSPLSDGWSL